MSRQKNDDQLPNWMSIPNDEDFSSSWDNPVYPIEGVKNKNYDENFVCDIEAMQITNKILPTTEQIKKMESAMPGNTVSQKIREKLYQQEDPKEDTSTQYIIMLQKRVVHVDTSFQKVCNVVSKIVKDNPNISDDDITILKTIPLDEVLQNI